MVKGVIFDMDGTMFDTERLSTKGWMYAGEKLGVELPRSLVDAFRGTNPTAIRNNCLFFQLPYFIDQTHQRLIDHLICVIHSHLPYYPLLSPFILYSCLLLYPFWYQRINNFFYRFQTSCLICIGTTEK